MKRILILFLALTLLLLAVACEKPADILPPLGGGTEDTTQKGLDITACYTEKHAESEEATCFVQFELSGGATFVIELYPEEAPKTVAHFQNLVADGHYNGLTFHRVYKDLCVYGGDVNGKSDTPVTVEGEFADNGCTTNTLKHERGTISLMHGSDPDSATCQFFIMQKALPGFDGKYAVFGRVVLGMETIDAIASITLTEEQPSNDKVKPVVPPVIEKVTFITEPEIPENNDTVVDE